MVAASWVLSTGRPPLGVEHRSHIGRSGVTYCAPSVALPDTGRRSAPDSGTSAAEGLSICCGARDRLANYLSLAAGLSSDPATLLRAAGVRDQDVGNYDAFISISSDSQS